MTDFRVYLDNAVDALQRDVMPAVEGDAAARHSLSAVLQILLRLKENFPETGGPLDANPPASADMHFGGVSSHDTAARRAADAVASLGLPAAIDEISREGSIVSAINERVMARLAKAPAAVGSADSRDKAPGEPDFPTAAVESYLKDRLACSELKIESCRVLLGGRSKITVLMMQSGCRDLPAEFVLRRDAAVNLTGGVSVADEFSLLGPLHEAGVKVPRPLVLCEEDGIVGAPFMLVERLAGASGEIYRTPPSRPLLLDVARNMARFHLVPAERFGMPLTGSRDDTIASLQQEIADVRASWDACNPPPSICIEAAFAWLSAHVDWAVDGPVALVHGDILFHNILFEDEVLTGILDWELARIGYPAADLGYFRRAVREPADWQAFMSAYREAGGPETSDRAIDFHAVWSNVRMATLSAQCRRMILEGATRDISLTAVCLHDILIWNGDLADHLTRAARHE